MAMLMSCNVEPTNSPNTINTIKYIANQHGYIMTPKRKTQLTVPQVIAMRDHMKVSTDTIHRREQSVKTFVPLLRGFISTAIRQKVLELEKDGVVPFLMHGVNCIIAKKDKN